MPTLQKELKKKKPFESIEQEAVLNLLRASDQIQNRLGKLFREFGLTSSQYNVLRILRGEGKPLPSLEIASRTIQVVPAITGLIDRLEKQGLVERERSEEDRRVVYVSITEKAKKILKKIDKPLMQMHEETFQCYSKKEAEELIRLLEKLRSGMSQ